MAVPSIACSCIFPGMHEYIYFAWGFSGGTCDGWLCVGTFYWCECSFCLWGSGCLGLLRGTVLGDGGLVVKIEEEGYPEIELLYISIYVYW